MAICVRIVLPSDELVRVTCVKRETRVRDLLRHLRAQVTTALVVAREDKQQQQKKKPTTREQEKEVVLAKGDRRSQQVFPLSSSNHRAALERLAFAKQHGGDNAVVAVAWELVLVRTGLALDSEAFVRESLQDLDILEYRPQQRRLRKSQDHSPIRSDERTSNSTTPQSPQQVRSRRRSSSLPTQLAARTRTTGFHPEPRKRRLKLRVSRGGSLWLLRCSGTRQTRDSTPQSPPPALEGSTVLLRGAMQLLDQLEALEAEVSALLLCARDADAKGGNACKIDELLPPLLRVFRALFQPKQQQQQLSTHNSSVLTRFPIEDFTQDLSRALKDAATESLRPPVAPVLMRGWVVCAEWGAFWRNTRRDYACLCDDGVLSFFSSERQCSEYLFALTVARNSSGNADPAMLKINASQSQIDLTDRASGWSVRKGDTEASGTARHAFALFDGENKLRLIMDVESDDEATVWLTAIGAELKQSELLDSVRISCNAFFYKNESLEDPLSSNTHVNTRPTQFKLPLRWLHAQMERQNGRSARHQRLQCANLNQARKDFRRDCLMINDELFPGAGVDTLLLALTSRLLSTLTPANRKQESGAGAEPLEMVAMRLAKELLVCSARTDGGGDILDALHLVFPSDRFSICPRASEMEPIAMSLSSLSSSSSSSLLEPVTPVAGITIRMSYWVIPSGSIAEHEELQNRDHELLTEKKTMKEPENLKRGARRTQCEDENEKLEVVGAFHRKLVGDFCKWHEVDGHVNIEFLPAS